MGRWTSSWVGVLAVAIIATGCTGNIEDPGGSIGGPGGGGPGGGPLVRPDGSFECNPDATGLTPLRRLSEIQYRNTLADLFAPVGVDANSDASAELDRVPADDADMPFRGMDARLSDLHIRAFVRVADRMATVTATNLSAVAGDCATEPTASAACIDAFLDDFAMRAYRRPLTADERDRYHALNDGSRDGPEVFRSVVFSLLLAPQFLNHVQVEGEGDDVFFALGPYETASRISYHFWQSMPDAELFAAAASGEILTEDGYLEQLTRVVEDPRTEDTITSFYGEWFDLGWLGAFPATAGFETLTEDLPFGAPGESFIAAANDEVLAMTRHFTFATDGTLSDLFLTDLSFTDSPELAAVYGVPVWDGAGAYPVMPGGERAGILTRSAFLFSGTHETHPIHRGAEIRRNILCDALPQPDPTALPDGALTPPPVTDDQTTRQRFEAKTANEPCISCHTAINPIGFVLESYDALGRFRVEERVIDEMTGEELARLPIDSATTPAIGSDPDVVVDTGIGLSEEVVDSGKTESCFSRQYFRFTYGRDEGASDGCALERVRGVLSEGGSLRDALRGIALDPSFRSRRVL